MNLIPFELKTLLGSAVRPTTAKVVAMSVLGQNLLSDKLDQKWVEFRRMAISSGLTFASDAELGLATHFISLELDTGRLKRVRGAPISNRMLVRVEPRSVHPRQYRQKWINRFGKVLVLSSYQKTSNSDEIWMGGHLPTRDVVRAHVQSSSGIEKAEHIGMINENKSSAVKGNLYSLRGKAIKTLSKAGFKTDVGGVHWDNSLFWHIMTSIRSIAFAVSQGCLPHWSAFRTALREGPNLKLHGRVDSQIEFLAQYQFALVIENEATYVSEKILNAIMAHSIPIYVGPELESIGLPRGVALQASPTPYAILKTLTEFDTKKQTAILEIGKEWITSVSTVDRWGITPGFERLLSRINDFVMDIGIENK